MSNSKKKTVNTRKKKTVNTSKKKTVNTRKKKTVNTRKKKVSSEKKIDSGEKKLSSSKKPTKSFIYSIFNSIVHILIQIISIFITTLAFGYLYNNNFKIFVSLVISSLSLKYMYKHIKTPKKVDSQKNIIKLPLSKFKLYVKKIVEIIKPLLSIMNSSLKLFTILILVETFFELSKEYNKSHEDMTGYLKSLFITYDYETIRKVNHFKFLKNNKERIIKLCFPNIDMNNLDEVNRLVRKNIFRLHKIGEMLFRERKLLENFILPDEKVNINILNNHYLLN